MSRVKVNMEFLNKMQGSEKVKCTLGGDPEFFVAEKATGVILNADRFFPGKDAPIKINAPGKKVSKLYFDGIQAELGFAHNTCRETVCYTIANAMRTVEKRIGGEHSVVLRPAVRVKRSIINNAHPEARVFGCMPDFNAYSLSTNTCEMDATTHPYRYAGGHIHIGWSSPYLKEGHAEYELVKRPENHIKTIRFLDLITSIPTLPLDNAPGSRQRRDKYGKAGCFRPTPYGVEYRTPSCWWMGSDITTSLVLGLARNAWTMLVNGWDSEFRRLIGGEDEVVRGIVDEGDVKESYKLWEKMRPYMITLGSRWNPLNMGNVYYTKCEPQTSPEKMFGITLPSDDCISSLAMFEYMVKNGMGSVMTADPLTEWSKSSNGMCYGAYHRKIHENQDFMGFQKDFFNKTLAGGMEC